MAEILSKAASPPASTILAVAPCNHHVPAPWTLCGLSVRTIFSNPAKLHPDDGILGGQEGDFSGKEYPPRKPTELTPGSMWDPPHPHSHAPGVEAAPPNASPTAARCPAGILAALPPQWAQGGSPL